MHNDRRCEPHSGASQLGAETHRRASPLSFSLRHSEIRLPRRIWSTRADVAFWPIATLPQEFISQCLEIGQTRTDVHDPKATWAWSEAQHGNYQNCGWLSLVLRSGSLPANFTSLTGLSPPIGQGGADRICHRAPGEPLRKRA